MNLNAIINKLQLKVLSGKDNLQKDVSGGYISDLLSDVIANSQENNLWITLQTHQNIIAVAKLKDLAGIIIVNDREPSDDTINKANEESVPLLCTNMSAYEVSGKLYTLMSSKD